MKLIQCILLPGKLDEVVAALQPFTTGMTAREVRCSGPDGGWHGVYRGVEYQTLLSRVLLDIAADDTWVDDIIRIVAETAHTGEAMDGSIHVLPIVEAYHVRTGFMDS